MTEIRLVELANLVCDILFVGLVSGEKMAFGMVIPSETKFQRGAV